MTTYRNGRLPASMLVKLPASWCQPGQVEHLTRDAHASLTRMFARMGAAGIVPRIWDAYRSAAGQLRQLEANYRRVSRPRRSTSERTGDGSTWVHRAGKPIAASIGWSKHGGVDPKTGRLVAAIDVHPATAQRWMKKNGKRFGWYATIRSEPWHFEYRPSKDRYRAEGVIDHSLVQRVVGAKVDGLIGPATAEKVKAWQKAHGLPADGIAGPATRKKMGVR